MKVKDDNFKMEFFIIFFLQRKESSVLLGGKVRALKQTEKHRQQELKSRMKVIFTPNVQRGKENCIAP